MRVPCAESNQPGTQLIRAPGRRERFAAVATDLGSDDHDPLADDRRRRLGLVLHPPGRADPGADARVVAAAEASRRQSRSARSATPRTNRLSDSPARHGGQPRGPPGPDGPAGDRGPRPVDGTGPCRPSPRRYRVILATAMISSRHLATRAIHDQLRRDSTELPATSAGYLPWTRRPQHSAWSGWGPSWFSLSATSCARTLAHVHGCTEKNLDQKRAAANAAPDANAHLTGDRPTPTS